MRTRLGEEVGSLVVYFLSRRLLIASFSRGLSSCIVSKRMRIVSKINLLGNLFHKSTDTDGAPLILLTYQGVVNSRLRCSFISLLSSTDVGAKNYAGAGSNKNKGESGGKELHGDMKVC